MFHPLPATTCLSLIADPIVKADCEHFPFKVVSGGGDKPSIEGEAAVLLLLRCCKGHACVVACGGDKPPIEGEAVGMLLACYLCRRSRRGMHV